MEEVNKKDPVGKIIPTDSRTLAERSTSLMRRGLRSLSNWDSVIIEIGKVLTSSLELELVLRTIMEKVDEHLHPDFWSLLLVDEAKKQLYYELAVGKGAQALKDVRIKIGDDIEGWVAQHNEVVVVPDLSCESRFFSIANEKTKSEMGSLVAVPMLYRDRCLGVIELIYGIDREDLSQADVSLVKAVADFAAVAIGNAQHVRRLHELTITDELTELYNWKHYDFILDTEVNRSQRYGYTFSVLRIDINNFGELAKSLSYYAIRGLLFELGKFFKSAGRLIDFVFYSPDFGFILILPQTSKEDGCQIARRLHKSIRETVWLEALHVHLKTSIFVASYPDDAETKAELIQSLDTAVESAVVGGGVFASPDKYEYVFAANVGRLEPL